MLNDIFRYMIEEEEETAVVEPTKEAEEAVQQEPAAEKEVEEPAPVAVEESEPKTLTSSEDKAAVEHDAQTVDKQIEEKIVKEEPKEEEAAPAVNGTEETKEEAIAHFQDSPVAGTSVDFATDLAQGVPEIFGIGEVVGLVFAAIVLIVMLGTLIAASLPIVTAVVGVGVGVTASLAFSATGSPSPRPAVRMRVRGTPCDVRYDAAAAARRSESLRLYASSPCASVWPTTIRSVSG